LTFNAWQWLLAVLAAMLVGVAKTGITGLSLLFVSMFASIMPARRSTGVVLPLMIVGDIVAVLAYRRHAQWKYLWKLFPWAGTGIVIGYLALGRMNDDQTRQAIGAIIVALAALHVYRRLRPVGHETEHGAWFAPVIGVLAGFTTLVSNSSGPLMVIYLLAMRLPKMEYMGTMAVFFMLLNFFKLPFMISLGLVNRESLMLNLELAPAVLIGTWLGNWLLRRINQKAFETIALVLTLCAAAKMFV
jgi:uncharacterized membrane protein YfcA